MATSVHYIRTIHTSFTAAHPHSSSAWATHASSTSVARTHTHANILLNLTSTYNNLPQSAKYPPGLQSPVVGRKRSASIRGMPASYAQRMQPQRVKFDPFAEDSSESSSIPPASSVLYNSHSRTPAARTSAARPAASIPYTIQIPPAGPADIQRLHQQQQHYRQQQQQQPYPRALSPQPLRARQQQPAPQRATTPAPAVAAPPAAPVPDAKVAAKERDARSRIVAGILLNRVHAVGKPMRRRSPSADQPKPYVPSGLSTCIALEA
ncbi:hypothetical protein D9756_008811 [Leucocoprinus leucothites]|uniref:Uncharacterized protein n=1 Tax=Leucocoprinus leucothites TaxID=201217 RepID=A0A8H5CX79_9AGAR|nr:hypothetical protein D9756_008811 [Leucoagaricus leucothites]